MVDSITTNTRVYNSFSVTPASSTSISKLSTLTINNVDNTNNVSLEFRNSNVSELKKNFESGGTIVLKHKRQQYGPTFKNLQKILAISEENERVNSTLSSPNKENENLKNTLTSLKNSILENNIHQSSNLLPKRVEETANNLLVKTLNLEHSESSVNNSEINNLIQENKKLSEKYDVQYKKNIILTNENEDLKKQNSVLLEKNRASLDKYLILKDNFNSLDIENTLLKENYEAECKKNKNLINENENLTNENEVLKELKNNSNHIIDFLNKVIDAKSAPLNDKHVANSEKNNASFVEDKNLEEKISVLSEEKNAFKLDNSNLKQEDVTTTTPDGKKDKLGSAKVIINNEKTHNVQITQENDKEFLISLGRKMQVHDVMPEKNKNKKDNKNFIFKKIFSHSWKLMKGDNGSLKGIFTQTTLTATSFAGVGAMIGTFVLPGLGTVVGGLTFGVAGTILGLIGSSIYHIASESKSR